MSFAATHPPEDELLCAVMGQLRADLKAHLDNCTSCRERVNRERATNPVLADAAARSDEFWDEVYREQVKRG